MQGRIQGGAKGLGNGWGVGRWASAMGSDLALHTTGDSLYMTGDLRDYNCPGFT